VSTTAAHEITHHVKNCLEVQIFGIKKSADTRKALRFFSERRIRTHFVDLMEKPASLGELRRFAQKFGVSALIDKDSRVFDELGLRYAQLSDERWLSRLAEEPLLLRLPLVRSGKNVMIGADESIWRAWMAADQ
jgi:arsenate reductase-like glutaredoxin family protein